MVDVIKLPTNTVINLAFGGPNLEHLMVTSAALPINIATGVPKDEPVNDSAGSLFIVSGLSQRGRNGRKLSPQLMFPNH